MSSFTKLGLLLLTIFGAIMARADPRVLVYTATMGYRHDSIPTAIEVLEQQGPNYNVSFDFTEDRNQFTQDNLANYDGILFVSTSEEVLDETGKAAFQDWLQKGGVFAGAHSASACLYNSPFFNATVGALFDYHPDLQSATFLPVNKSHPATAHLPDRWTFVEEVYYYRSDPRAFNVDLLLTVDESSYARTLATIISLLYQLTGNLPGFRPSDTGQSTGTYNEGEPHPIAWCQHTNAGSLPLKEDAPGAGRSFYTSLGHLNSTWHDATFQQHLLNGLVWALEGRTTRAYNANALVGNATLSESSVSTTNSAPTVTDSAASQSGSSTFAGTSTNQAGSASVIASSPAASSTANSASGKKLAAGAVALAVAGAAVVGI